MGPGLSVPHKNQPTQFSAAKCKKMSISSTLTQVVLAIPGFCPGASLAWLRGVHWWSSHGELHMLLIYGVIASDTRIPLSIWLKTLPVFRHLFQSLATIYSNPFLRKGLFPGQEPVARSSVVPAGHWMGVTTPTLILPFGSSLIGMLQG